MGRFNNWLRDLLPRTGRMIKENGEVFNEADSEFLNDLSEPTDAVFRKRGYFWSHLREDVSGATPYYYYFKAPSDKHVVVYARTLEAGEGPVRLETVVGATFTPGSGTLVPPINLFTGGPAAGLIARADVTGVTGGMTMPADYLFSAGNKVATAGSNALPTIVPPDLEIFLKITTESEGVNPGIRLALAYTEVVIPDDLV